MNPIWKWRTARLMAALVLTVATFAFAIQGRASAEVTHPMDALQEDEYGVVVETLKSADRLQENSLFALIQLHEPDKDAVLNWSKGDPIPRAAFVVIKQGKKTFEGVVDLKAKEVTSWREIENVQPNVLFTEWQLAQRVAQSNENWREAMRRRGYEDFSEGNFFCAPLTAGYLDIEQFEGRRILNVQCFDVRDAKTNMYGKPIEGLTVVVDLDEEKVVHIWDTGVVETPEDQGNYDEESVGKLLPKRKPTLISQPEGANFKVDGSVVEWRAWRFHVRMDRRAGTIVSLARFNDGDDERMVLYQGSLSEIFVPYMDPSVGWRYKTYMDAGEYGFGLFATPLQRGTDCPASAQYINALVAFDDGKPHVYPNVICVFERNAGNPNWRHNEFLNETHESRAQVDLVVRMIGTVGNYDYILDWVFTEAGEIVVNVGATGIDIPKAVETENMKDETAAEDTRYGTLAAKNIVLPFHDHYFNFRLDVDVDGRNNSFVKDRMVRHMLPSDNPRRSIWRLESEVAATEGDAKLKIDLSRPVQWRVINPDETNTLGSPVGYVLKPSFNIHQLMAENDWPARRAAFTNYNIWVTPYDRDQRYAGGFYVNQSKGEIGLASWTEEDRNVRDTDIVLWYTLGTHHITAPEDWPVLPTKWFSFRLSPFNFFDRSQVINLPDERFGVEEEEAKKE